MTADTKPSALLPAARLAEIRATFAAHDNGEAECDAQSLADFTRDLLAHLDTLTAPAPEGGGRRLYYALNPFAHHRAWEAHDADVRDRYDAQALALDAHGYARGFAAGADLANETTRHLIEARDLAQRTAEAAHAEIARLTAELAATKEDRR